MGEESFDVARRAAEAFMAANRAADPLEAARLRRRAYDLVDRMRDTQEARHPSPGGPECSEIHWAKVLPGRPRTRG